MAQVSNLKIGLQGGTESTLYASWEFNETSSSSSASTTAKVGDIVTIKSGAKYYNGVSIPSWVMSARWYVSQVKGDRAVINKSPDNNHAINSPININNIVPVKSTQTNVTENTLDCYKLEWFYDAGNGIWFNGGSANVTEKNGTYGMPSNAIKVKATVTPVSKKYTSNNKEVSYWTGTAVSVEYITSDSKPSRVSAPSVTIDKYNLKAVLDNIEDAKADQVEFEVVKEETKFASGVQSVVTARAIYSCQIAAGFKYRVRCRAVNLVGSSTLPGDWSPYSSEVMPIPQTVTNVTCSVESDNSVRINWTGDSTAISYTVEYTTNMSYFDSSSEVSSITVTTTYAYIKGLEKGKEWYFRVKATNEQGDSGWSEIVYKVIGTKPQPPTTWSLTTTAIIGEDVVLYWTHNSEDGSKQTQAQIEITINGIADIITIDTDSDKDELDRVYSYLVDLSSYDEGAEILWRIRTRGITFEYSDWSIQRTINIYAPPVAELHLGDDSGLLESFPYTISVKVAPNTQIALTYHISIIAKETYQTNDPTGNSIIVNAGTEVYSKIFNVMNNVFSYDLVPEDVTLENNQGYEVLVTVAMNSGLIATANSEFTVSWMDINYEPDATVIIDNDTLCAYIMPYCLDVDSNMVTDVVLSVYRREFDGEFTLILSDIENNGAITATDSHPLLDFARYRIVARNRKTSVNSYTDIPGIPVGESSIVIQWDEQWSKFEYAMNEDVEIPAWTGSMLRLPYNIDISESYNVDSSLVEYAGRKHPVSYYGTQKGSSQVWNTVIPKDDKETVYSLRRLAAWSGDVYVREPSGNGYMANITVSFATKHITPTIPVTFNVKRVEGDSQ